MPQKENDFALRASVSEIGADAKNPALQQSPRLEPELLVLTRDLAPDNRQSAELVIEAWHKPYAVTLIEDDPIKLRTLIAETERAILARYLELSASPPARSENLDLLNVVDALSELKRAIVAFRAA